MKIVFTGKFFICKSTFENRHLPRQAGFRWHSDLKTWYTLNLEVATRLEKYFDDSARKESSRRRIIVKSWTGSLSIPPHLELKDFQYEACHFALSRNRSYLALDPGMGKTIVAAVVAATIYRRSMARFVYLCPPFLTRNTEDEFNKWAATLAAERYNAGKMQAAESCLIVPDSLIRSKLTLRDIKAFIQNVGEKILIVDEAHRYKNPEAARTKALLGYGGERGIADLFDRVIYLSGTPMPNRPIELFAILNHSAPECIGEMDKFQYAKKYCAAFKGPWGWDYSGNSNMEELAERIHGRFMLRLKKGKEFTKKSEEMVVLSDDAPPGVAKLDSRILEKYSPDDLMKDIISLDLDDGEELHISTYRKELGLAKVKSVVEFVKYVLEETEESLLLFAIHKDVIKLLEKELATYEPIVVTGQTSMRNRHELVKTFQNDAEKKLFIGNIQAAGVGVTLTKATRVVFAEFSWVPMENEQAEDRTHRIGQLGDVLVQYLVFQNSVDKAVVQTFLEKRKVVSHI